MNRSQYVRVSEVLSCLQNFSHIPEKILHAKQLLGSNVHAAINDSILGEFPIVDIRELGYFQSFEKWRDIANPVFVASEERYYDDLKMLTGQIDALIKFHQEEECILIDFKTSVQESPIWRLQGHLYYHLLCQNFSCRISKRILFVKLDRHGDIPKIHEYKIDSTTLKYCLSLVDSYWKQKELEKK
jgi:hypothetical protein